MKTDKTRPERLAQTEGMPLASIASRKLIRRDDWIFVAGAIYPANGHHWTWKKRGGIRYIGPCPHADKKYIPVAERLDTA